MNWRGEYWDICIRGTRCYVLWEGSWGITYEAWDLHVKRIILYTAYALRGSRGMTPNMCYGVVIIYGLYNT